MSEYINREDVLKILSEKNAAWDAYQKVQALPAADVRPVVYCRDCKHAEESMVSGCVYCNEMERARINEGWCAWGEMKEGEA